MITTICNPAFEWLEKNTNEINIMDYVVRYTAEFDNHERQHNVEICAVQDDLDNWLFLECHERIFNFNYMNSKELNELKQEIESELNESYEENQKSSGVYFEND